MAAAAAAAAAAAVDLITFVRTAGKGRVIGADVPLLSLPVRKRVSVLKAVLEAPKVGTLRGGAGPCLRASGNRCGQREHGPSSVLRARRGRERVLRLEHLCG